MPANASEAAIAVAWQKQVADFLGSDGKVLSDPNTYVSAPFSSADKLFEAGPKLPEALNFLQFPP
jgi:hypothetical protein